MAGVTLSSKPAGERDRVLEARRGARRLEAGDLVGSQSNGTNRQLRSRISAHADTGDTLVARKPADRQDQTTGVRVDHQQQQSSLGGATKEYRAGVRARHNSATSSSHNRLTTGVSSNNSTTGTRLVDKLARGSLIGGPIASRPEKPVSGADTVLNYTIGPLNGRGGAREQVSSFGGGENQRPLGGKELKSILKEHQTGTLADKTQRRSSYTAAGKEQESHQEKQQQRPLSGVEDNHQSRSGSGSSATAEVVERESNEQQQQQRKSRRETETSGKLVRDAAGRSSDSKNQQEERQGEEEEDEEEEEEEKAGGGEQRSWTTSGGVGKRPPTFGTTPYKLSRLPYYSYYGKARNVDLVTPGDRNTSRREQATRRIAGDESSGHSSTLSQQSVSSLGSQTGGRKSSAARAVSAGRRSREELEERRPTHQRESSSGRRGYSNISNLFPGQPAQVRRAESRVGLQQVDQELISKKHSSSLSNLSQQKRSFKDRTRDKTGPREGEYLLERSSPLERKMRRQNSSLSASRLANRYTANQGQARPTSAFGGHPLSPYHRSPSAMSLMYGGSTGVSPVYLGQPPIDPDCPVHGYSPLGGATMSKSTQQLNSSAGGGVGGGGFGSPEAELLYEPQPEGLYADRVARNLYPTGSPSQPMQVSGGATLTKRQPSSVSAATGTGAAYYNRPNRFSVYHSMGNDYGTRSSLAPPNEQLRRILGYQPQPRPVHLHPQWAYSRPFIHLQDSGWRSPSPSGPLDPITGQPQIKPVFMPYNQLQDTQAVRAVDFHPSGEVYAVGSNSRVLRICAYPADYELRHYDRDQASGSPRVLFKFLQVHRGSIYCVQFNATGQLLATGSNDQTVHIARYNSTTHCPDGDEFRLTMHDGTVRDLCFIDDSTNGSALLLSAGGGDNKIYVTDCDTITPFQSMTGHTQTVMSLHHWGGANFVSASLDKSIRFWDLRTRSCTSIVSAPPSTVAGNQQGAKWAGPGAPVCAVKVDPSGRLMASGHSDSTCMLYDIRGARIIQSYKPHDDEVRTLSFSPKSYYLLSGGYDGRIMLTDLQGDLTQPLPTCCVAECEDKIVQAKWHPSDFTFVTTSADKTATLWALPTE